MKPVTIVFSGLAGSGKDTAADYLVERFGFEKVSLADPLKRICLDLFDFSYDQLWGSSEERNEPDKRYPRPCPEFGPSCYEHVEYLTPRMALQTLGSWGRDMYRNVWLDVARRRVAKVLANGISCVVPDARFANEIEAFRSDGAKVVRILRPGAGLAGEAAKHASETEQVTIPEEKFDVVILNNGTLRDIELCTRRVVLELSDEPSASEVSP